MINPEQLPLNSDLRRRTGGHRKLPRFLPRRLLVLCLTVPIVLLAGFMFANAQTPPPPVLVSEPTSTRAIALDSLTFTPEPFALVSSHSWGADSRTRIMLFALNLSLQPGEDLSSVTADAEDSAHRNYNLLVEYVSPVPEQQWLSAVVLRLSDDLGDVGDVLVRVSHQGVRSNRVRVAIGHKGGGLPDDPGSSPTPAPPYFISGQVMNGGTGLSGVTVKLTGAQTDTFITDASGAYQFTVLSAGIGYTITASKSYYDFNPSSQTFAIPGNNQTNINFTATRQAYTIGGHVLDETGQGVDGVQLSVTNEAGTTLGTSFTVNGGNYSFANLPAGFGYTVTPVNNSFFTFTPLTSLLTGNLTLDFTGVRRLYAISGRTIDGTGTGIGGVTVNLSGSRSAGTTTDNSGAFSFTGLPAGGNYTLTPAATAFYAFAAQDFTNLSANQSPSFPGTLRQYSISGQVTDGTNGLGGVTVNLSGSRSASITTDSSGAFSFNGLPAGGNYTVTPPTTAFYTFTSQSFSNLSSNQSAKLTGTLRQYSISGHVMDGTNGLGGVTVNLSGSPSASTTTDSSGAFSFSGLLAGGNYTVTPPTTAFYTFTSRSFSNLSSNQSANLTGTLRQYSISGRVTDGANGVGGLNVVLSGASQTTATTDSTGNYTFANLDAGRNYTVSPSNMHYIFTPASQAFNNLSGNQTGNYQGTLRSYNVSGRVTDGSGQGLIGITVMMNGSQTATVLTGNDGSYSFTATALGSYTLTPSVEQDWYTFAPFNQSLNPLTSDQTINFTATLAPIPNPPYVLEFDGTPKTVNYGSYWRENVDLGHFFWEFWAMPGNDANSRYMLTDGYGGYHALLFGFIGYGSAEPGRYRLSGNVFDGVNAVSFISDQGPARGEWGHFAVGWDGQNLITYLNGVPVSKTPFIGPRRTPGPGGGGGYLLMGGSDHNNFDGRIAQVRGYEGSNPREDPAGADNGRVASSFAPQTVFSVEGNLLSYYFRSAPRVADLSMGHDGSSHPGVLLGTLYSMLQPCPGCPLPNYVIDPTAPNFATGAASAPVLVDTPAPVPGGARIFDSFSRADSTYVFNGNGGLGATEGGTAGSKNWETNQQSSKQPFGILNGLAVLLANETSITWIPTGSISANLDLRVDRHAGSAGTGLDTGLSFRVVDDHNFFFAYTRAGNDASSPRTLTVGYYLNGLRTNLVAGANLPASWTTLRVVTKSSGEITVYADATQVYAITNNTLSNATGAGLYNNSSGLGLVNRWDNFVVFDVP